MGEPGGEQVTRCDNCPAEMEDYQRGSVKYPDGRLGQLCGLCWNADVLARRAQRKARLAIMPRCEAAGCRARGRWKVGGNTRLCGRHLSRAKANRARAAGADAILWWLDQTGTDRESILRYANEAR